MSKKQTRYALNYDYLEEVLLTLGEEYRAAVKLMDDYMGQTMPISSSAYGISRRLSYLSRVRENLLTIYDDVNQETKNIIDLLYIAGESFEVVSKKLMIKERNLLFRHHLIVEEMLLLEGMASGAENKKRVKRRRNIPKKVKEEVFKRDGGACINCQSGKDLHYHHIKRYANGGKDTVDNLTLLCALCHAQEHRGERSYHLLKAMTTEG